MSSPISDADVWFCCGDCDNNLAPYNGLVKELVSHRNRESSWLLFRENAGLNVKFEGRKAINEAPASVTPIEVKDEGQTTQTDMADIHCSNCDGHVGWKIIRERNNHPIVHKGQFILQRFYGRGRFSLQVIKQMEKNMADGSANSSNSSFCLFSYHGCRCRYQIQMGCYC